MDTVAVFVGLDYHQDFVQVCVLDAEGTTVYDCNLLGHFRIDFNKIASAQGGSTGGLRHPARLCLFPSCNPGMKKVVRLKGEGQQVLVETT